FGEIGVEPVTQIHGRRRRPELALRRLIVARLEEIRPHRRILIPSWRGPGSRRYGCGTLPDSYPRGVSHTLIPRQREAVVRRPRDHDVARRATDFHAARELWVGRTRLGLSVRGELRLESGRGVGHDCGEQLHRRAGDRP